MESQNDPHTDFGFDILIKFDIDYQWIGLRENLGGFL